MRTFITIILGMLCGFFFLEGNFLAWSCSIGGDGVGGCHRRGGYALQMGRTVASQLEEPEVSEIALRTTTYQALQNHCLKPSQTEKVDLKKQKKSCQHLVLQALETGNDLRHLQPFFSIMTSQEKQSFKKKLISQRKKTLTAALQHLSEPLTGLKKAFYLGVSLKEVLKAWNRNYKKHKTLQGSANQLENFSKPDLILNTLVEMMKTNPHHLSDHTIIEKMKLCFNPSLAKASGPNGKSFLGYQKNLESQCQDLAFLVLLPDTDPALF